jgi:hypothetical protein
MDYLVDALAKVFCRAQNLNSVIGLTLLFQKPPKILCRILFNS